MLVLKLLVSPQHLRIDKSPTTSIRPEFRKAPLMDFSVLVAVGKTDDSTLIL